MRPKGGDVTPIGDPAVKQAPKVGHDSAAELLSQWRSAERDTIAAKAAAEVATLAVSAAESAEEAASQAEAAAQVAMDAAVRARAAAEQAKSAASHVSEGSQTTTTTAEGQQARAEQDVDEAEQAEIAARDRFHGAQAEGFPKDSS